MKVKIDLDMSAEEARTLMGLPDLEPMQQRLLEQLEKQLASNLSYMDPEALVRAVLPAGAQGLEKFQDMMWGMARSAMGGGSKSGGAKSGGTKKGD
ncbi:DUF6489 family protein [Parvibaculum sp.]|jgi:hypothetical protein|uniref:DUF6489 family protein n=1 Tax=Parvibaculum sp. TaxID=2024848 RepID=UPI001B0AFCDC|nr:DUF6489 family protein [Parvibaculum sp.]MBO6634203.1 hypothetical protein [Parvibaculum sp.]MBO6677450.1 hypothetical protein [Parvibaculum sp.]MBO6685093.1 hypothetical protein [Parvibaculum sp.]